MATFGGVVRFHRISFCDKPIGASPRAGAVCLFGGGRGCFGKKGVTPHATDFREKILCKLTILELYSVSFPTPLPVSVNYRHWLVGISVYHFGITVHVIFCLSYGFN
jgi:hypothetical protein